MTKKHKRNLQHAYLKSIECNWASQTMSITFENTNEEFVIQLQWWAVAKLVEEIRTKMAAEMTRCSGWLDGLKRRIGIT